MYNVCPLKKLTFVLLIVCTLAVLKAKADGYDEKAKQILYTTGVEGGLIVHLGCGDGRLTSSLRINDSFIIHDLDNDSTNITKARAHIHNAEIYGPVSVELFSGKVLPYADRLVNLLVAEDHSNVPMKEVKLVLAPEIASYSQQNKARP